MKEAEEKCVQQWECCRRRQRAEPESPWAMVDAAMPAVGDGGRRSLVGLFVPHRMHFKSTLTCPPSTSHCPQRGLCVVPAISSGGQPSVERLVVVLATVLEW
ncbi:hypothetical protein E2C01_032548 [Portunus trituberculatus]|uniref:Uncharacterized protein n=1 Tax=Portunus trituberculatus TaxID=210409 RepID=A0A5B7F1B7_PORTR|nr:hypothetical protein [Portunus trituberculatus]